MGTLTDGPVGRGGGAAPPWAWPGTLSWRGAGDAGSGGVPGVAVTSSGSAAPSDSGVVSGEGVSGAAGLSCDEATSGCFGAGGPVVATARPPAVAAAARAN